jgi:hypothetical protein
MAALLLYQPALSTQVGRQRQHREHGHVLDLESGRDSSYLLARLIWYLSHGTKFVTRKNGPANYPSSCIQQNSSSTQRFSKSIRRGTAGRKEREAVPVPHAGKGSKDSGVKILKLVQLFVFLSKCIELQYK